MVQCPLLAGIAKSIPLIVRNELRRAFQVKCMLGLPEMTSPKMSTQIAKTVIRFTSYPTNTQYVSCRPYRDFGEDEVRLSVSSRHRLECKALKTRFDGSAKIRLGGLSSGPHFLLRYQGDVRWKFMSLKSKALDSQFKHELIRSPAISLKRITALMLV